MMSEYITREPIDAAALMQSVAGSERGAATLFLGTVRRAEGDGPVVAMDYSAYEEMVVTEFDRILGEARARWPGGRFAAKHRLGRLELGEASIAIAAATPHRGESFDACRFVIEEVKRRLPVWKKEHFEDGSERWRENESLDSSN